MTTISTSTSNGIVLSVPSYANPVLVDQGVAISSTGTAALEGIGAVGWTIANAGLIAGPTATGAAGIKLDAGGLVNNQQTGTVTGWEGIYVLAAAGQVVNAGYIAGLTKTG